MSTTSYNANNQQTTFGTNTETYDLNGNLATVNDGSDTTTYTWNARNQLTGISNTGFSASFTYDSFGRRTGRTVQGTTTNYVYDGLNPVQEKNGSTITANLITGLGIDEFFQRTDGVGSRVLLTDALGSTVALGDSSGTLQTQGPSQGGQVLQSHSCAASLPPMAVGYALLACRSWSDHLTPAMRSLEKPVEPATGSSAREIG